MKIWMKDESRGDVDSRICRNAALWREPFFSLAETSTYVWSLLCQELDSQNPSLTRHFTLPQFRLLLSLLFYHSLGLREFCHFAFSRYQNFTLMFKNQLGFWLIFLICLELQSQPQAHAGSSVLRFRRLVSSVNYKPAGKAFSEESWLQLPGLWLWREFRVLVSSSCGMNLFCRHSADGVCTNCTPSLICSKGTILCCMNCKWFLTFLSDFVDNCLGFGERLIRVMSWLLSLTTVSTDMEFQHWWKFSRRLYVEYYVDRGLVFCPLEFLHLPMILFFRFFKVLQWRCVGEFCRWCKQT